MIKNEELLRAYAPAAFATAPEEGRVSDRYSFLPTTDILNLSKFTKLRTPQPYSYEDTSPETLQDLVLDLQKSGGDPYIFMGGTNPEESINYYTTGRPGYRAGFRPDKSIYLNPETGDRFSQEEYDFLNEEAQFAAYLEANQDNEAFRDMLKNKKRDIPNLVNFDKLRQILPEERVDTLIINSPFAERLREGSGSEKFLRGSKVGGRHPLESYIGELAHAHQFSNDDLEYIKYLNERVAKEHERLGGAGKYKNPFSIEYEAHDIIEPHYWNYLEESLQGGAPTFNIDVPSYRYYQQGVVGPENYSRMLNEE